MALSNRDRISRGFELIAEGLGPYVEEAMTAAAPAGKDWTEVLAARDAAAHGAAREYSKADPHVLLRCVTEEWRAFKAQPLSRVEQSFASELRDVRNRWAHNESFTADDTYRALDTMERLLLAVHAVGPADEVRRLRVDLQSRSFEQETKRAVRAAAIPNVPGTGLKPWRDVITPHPDVASGRFAAAEFAADLYQVSRGEGSDEYVRPVDFFRRTYVTEGLRDLLGRAARRLAGDENASPVVNLQTNFGGGKTHSMLAVYHLCSGTPLTDLPQEVQEAVGETTLPPNVRPVTLVGNHLPLHRVTKPDGTEVSTLWGELAWQLDGADAYAIVAEADRTRTNPGASLTELIRKYAPCLILVDEWVSYARQLVGRDDLDAGTFETQFTFAQTLTEVVSATPGALLVVSIPASHRPDDNDTGSDLEVGGAHGQEALRRLQNVVRRVADQWRPATADESFEIVRRRLFAEPDAAARADVSAVARQFVEFYKQHHGEFPRECYDAGYEQRIKNAYPIHPELFDRLYEDWSTLDRFQRTRGVLRLLSTVVHALWAAQDASPLIMPGSVPLDVGPVANELTQYLPDAWKAVLDADVDGPASTPAKVDASRSTLGARALTRRLARAVFVGSAPTLQSAHKGIERQNLWLGVAVPGDTVGNFGSAVDLLGQRATYFYVDGTRYWYDTQASVTRVAQDLAERLRDQPEEVWAEIHRRLTAERARRGDFARVHCPDEDTGEVPDDEDARLVVIHPRHAHKKGDELSGARDFAQRCLDTRGSAQRTNRNMLVFLAADERRMEELMDATRDYLAWQQVVGRAVEMDLRPQERAQAEGRLAKADETVALRVLATYIWALVPDQPDPARPSVWAEAKAEGSATSLAERVSAKLRQAGTLVTVYGPRNVRLDLNGPLRAVWDRGHVSLGELWSYYRRYPYLSRLRDRRVLDDAVRAVFAEFTWVTEGFALADGYDDTTGTYVGLALPHENVPGPIVDSTLLVSPALARAQRGAEGTAERGDGGDAAADAGAAATVPGADTPPAADAPPRRFWGTATVNAERFGRDFTRLAQEILPHLAQPGTDLTITVEIEARRREGFPPETIRTVSENARTLRIDHAFEGD